MIDYLYKGWSSDRAVGPSGSELVRSIRAAEFRRNCKAGLPAGGTGVLAQYKILACVAVEGQMR